MPLKKKAKVKAEFSMASMTDMIFLLLIFFVLNSSLVAPNALNLKLPGSSRTKVQVTDRTDDVSIGEDGDLFFNGKRISPANLDATLERKARPDYHFTISPKSGAPVKSVALVMDAARRFQIEPILMSPEK